MDNMIVNEKELVDLVNEYLSIKGDEFVVFPFEDRVKLFLGLVKDCDYKKDTFVNKVNEFKNYFFSEDELKRANINDINKHLSTFVIGDKQTKENRLVVLCSKNGIKADEEVDKDNLFAYEISFKNNSVEVIDVRQLKSRLLYNIYNICNINKDTKAEENTNDQLKNLDTAFEEFLKKSKEKQA